MVPPARSTSGPGRLYLHVYPLGRAAAPEASPQSRTSPEAGSRTHARAHARVRGLFRPQGIAKRALLPAHQHVLWRHQRIGQNAAPVHGASGSARRLRTPQTLMEPRQVALLRMEKIPQLTDHSLRSSGHRSPAFCVIRKTQADRLCAKMVQFGHPHRMAPEGGSLMGPNRNRVGVWQKNPRPRAVGGRVLWRTGRSASAGGRVRGWPNAPPQPRRDTCPLLSHAGTFASSARSPAQG